MKKVILAITLSFIAIFVSMDNTYASFTLSWATQTKITNSIAWFPTSYKNELVQDAIIKNWLNPATYSWVVATYAQFFGNSVIWNSDYSVIIGTLPVNTYSDIDVGTIWVEQINSNTYVDIDVWFIFAKWLDTQNYALIDIPSMIVSPLMQSILENTLQWNLVYRDILDKMLVKTNTTYQSDGTTNTGWLLTWYRVIWTTDMKDVPNNQNSNWMFNLLFQLKDNIGKRLFNVVK